MQSTPAPILKLENLKKHFPIRSGFFQRSKEHIRAVDGVDIQIPFNQTVGLVGESGSGKSTVAKLILKLIKPDDGRIFFQDQEISSLSERQFKPMRKEIQMIFQDPYSSLNPRMTIAQSITEGVRIAKVNSRSDQRTRVEQLLDMVGMPKASADRYPHEFSGGQRQRVGIIQAQIINLLKDLQRQLGLSYLFISHDLNVVSYICDHVCVMYNGQIMESAPADRLFDQPCHPYTLKLLAAVPDSQKSPAADAPPNALPETSTHPDTACAFAGQCPQWTANCSASTLEMHEIAPSHFVRCSQFK